MKKLLAILLTLTTPSWGAIAFVQSTSCNANTFTNACPYSSNITAGSLLIVGCVMSSNTDNFVLSDNKGQTYTAVGTSVQQGGSSVVKANLFYVKNAQAGATTVTCADGGSDALYVQQSVHEYSGANISTPFDTTISSAPTLVVVNPETKALTTAEANELVFGMAFAMGGAVSAQNGTLRESYVNNSYVASQDTIVVAPGARNSTFTQSTTALWIAIGAAFKLPSLGGTGTLTIK